MKKSIDVEFGPRRKINHVVFKALMRQHDMEQRALWSTRMLALCILVVLLAIGVIIFFPMPPKG